MHLRVYFIQLVPEDVPVLPTSVVRGQKNPLHLKFPARLRKARKAAKLSGSALSLAAGVNRNAVTNLEGGAWIPRLATLELLANALKISPAWLAYGMEEAWGPAVGAKLRCADLARRAKDTRIARGFTLREVGRRAEISEGSIRAIESGTMPSLDMLEQLAKALGVSPAWLAFGLGPMEAPKRRRLAPQDQTAPAAG